MGASLYDSKSVRHFAGIELAEDAIPDESTIARSRRLLEHYRLSDRIFSQIRKLSEEKRLLLKSGIIVDATIIVAPISTKNMDGERGRETHQVVEGKEWHHGLKAHGGTDRRGIVHTLRKTAENAAEITQMHQLPHRPEKEVFGDQAYWSESHWQVPKRCVFVIQSTAVVPAAAL